MNTNLTHLPENKQAELKAIVSALIPRYGEIEMIVLFGSYARGNWVEDKYVEKGITYEYKSDYDLLIVVSKNSQANADTFIQSVTGKLEELNLPTPVNPIFHGIEFVNQELREGNYFFGDIKKEGVLLFTTNRYQLDDKREMSPAEVQEKAKLDFNGWFESADDFFRIAKSELNIEKNKTAAFNLHQAAERYYGAIQLVFTGYKPKTHDLEILGKLAKACNIEFGKVFPRQTIQERQRFMLLKKAYVEARYNMDYKISKDDLDYLSERVQLLRKFTEEICGEKIRSFTI
ncbi:MAG: HEPN domain-containing protein [Bacteroidota bacterium]|nr:HEPN domain-containing protein [Bacteroidota bacterium]